MDLAHGLPQVQNSSVKISITLVVVVVVVGLTLTFKLKSNLKSKISLCSPPE